MFLRFIGSLLFALCVLFSFSSPAAATNVTVHCWCRTEALVCNHNTQTASVHGALVDLAADDSDAARDEAFAEDQREATCNVCRTYCSGLTGGTWTAFACESGYREELCGQCYADASSSCTVERGARVRTGSTGSSTAVTTELPRCPDAVQDVFPVRLGTPIGGVSQVNGLADYINVAYRYLVSIVLIVAIVMTVYGGFRYLFGASMGSVAAGKDLIRDALIGMLIVLGAYTILATINPATTILNLNPPTKIACVELDIPDALQPNRCQTDSDCPVAGQHCVETQFVFRTDLDQVVGSAIRTGALAGSEAGGAVGAATRIPGAETVGTWSGHVMGALGTAAGAGYYALFNIGGHVKACSDGTNGSPCDSSDDCRPGSYCLSNWNLCSQPSNLPIGAPCGSFDRAAGSTGSDSASCATDLECIRPSGSSWASRMAEGDYSICRGSVEPMLRINEYVSNDSRVPDSHMCYTNQDCGAVWDIGWITAEEVTGMACIGPENPWRGKYCYPDSRLQARYVHEDDPARPLSGAIRARTGGPFAVEPGVTPCVHNGGAGSAVTPLVCSGGPTTQYTCVYCPSTGERNWTFLQTGSPAAAEQIGVCHNKSVLDTPTPCSS